MNYELYSMGFY